MFFGKDKIKTFIINRADNHQAEKLLWLSIFLYLALFSFLVLKRYYFFSYNVSDLAIFNQVFFNTIHGRWFQESIIESNLLASHFSPIILFLLPFYYIKAGPTTLLILQTAFLALAAWPLFYLAKSIIKNKNLALLAVGFWLLNPMVQGANLDESHLLYLVPFVFFWSAYFYQQNKFYKFLLFFILALLIREDVALVMIGWSILALLDRRDKKWIWVPFFLASFYFVGVLAIISRLSVYNNYKFLVFYGWLGGHDLFSILLSWLTHPLLFLAHLFSWANISSLLIILLPLFYLPLLKPKYLFLALVPFLQLATVSTGLTAVGYMTRFCLIILPGIFIALIFALGHINNKQKFKGSDLVYKNIGFFRVLIGFTLVYFAFFLSPAKYVLFKEYNKQQRDWQQAAVESVPSTASVLATNNLLPKLSNRQNLYNIDYAYFGRTQFCLSEYTAPRVDYILVDYSDFLTSIADAKSNPSFSQYWPQIPRNWRQSLQDYELVRAENNLLLWQNKDSAKTLALKFYEINDKKSNDLSRDFLVASSSQLNQSHRVLKLTFQKFEPAEKNYLIRFYYLDQYFDMPLDYGLMSNDDWPGKLVSFYYYLDPSVFAYQVFSWQGVNKLGLENQVYLDKKVEPLTEKNFLNNN